MRFENGCKVCRQEILVIHGHVGPIDLVDVRHVNLFVLFVEHGAIFGQSCTCLVASDSVLDAADGALHTASYFFRVGTAKVIF